MTSHSPLFSIITITRNNLTGFIKTHDSLLAQSLNDYEWVIVDGNSIDGTQDYIAQKNLSGFCVSEHDSGIYNAMNKGIDRAKGQYLLFLNAGDTLADPDILLMLSHAIHAYNPDFIYGDALEECEDTHPFYKKARSHKKYIWGMFTHHQAMLYRREALDALRYNENYKIASDYEFTIRLLKTTNKIHYIPCAICFFERGGISQQNHDVGRLEQMDIKRRLKLCPYTAAILISWCQQLSLWTKTTHPAAYRALKKQKA